MDPTDLTIEILKGIREATRKTHEEIRMTNERIDELRTEVRNEFAEVRVEIRELRDRQTGTEVRLATELVAVAGEVRDLLREDRVLRDRVDDHERRLSEVERRTG
jgi:hypothetical protein